jgi:hypothetical protein
MASEHGGGDSLDVRSAADVADLVFAEELSTERAQTVLAAREQNGLPPLVRERAGDCLADSTRGSGDDRYALGIYRQTFT